MSMAIASHLLLAALGAGAPGAVVHRCTEPNGTQVFSDRSCASLGMSDRLPPPSSASPHRVSASLRHGAIRTCARSPDGLRRHLSDALHARDVNSLLGLIDWQGSGGGMARATTKRMQGIARRESLEVTLESAAPDPWDLPDSFGPVPGAGPHASLAPPAPTAIRIEQRATSGALESVRFGLTRDFGCYWLSI